MTTVKAEIIAIGTELLLGQIANTNGQWISQKLASKGVHVFHHHVVGDNHDRILNVLKESHERSDVIVITGGLGPTDDDLTKEVVAEFVGGDLIEDTAVLSKIKSYFNETNRVMTENNYKQAKVIEGAKVIPNKFGTAPGIIVSHQSRYFILLPGVPSEMKQMMTNSVLPFLEETYNLSEVIVSKMIRCIGIGESQLEMELKDLIEEQSNPTIALLSMEGEVAVRLTANASSEKIANDLIETKAEELITRIGQYIYGFDDQSLNMTIVQMLKEKQQSIAGAESLTGGKFSDAMVSIPGASEVFKGSIVSYSTESKVNILGVKQSFIDEFGTISEETAFHMAKQAKEKLKATYGISFTGVAGPEPSEGKPVGTVYICLYKSDSDYQIETIQYKNNRESIRNRAIKKGLELVFNYLK